MDESETDAVIDGLEAAYEYRDDAPDVVRALVARLTATPGAEVRLARLTILGINELVRERGPAAAALTLLELRDRAARDGQREPQARAERALSVLFREVGDLSAALEHAVAALALDDEALHGTLRCRLHLAMADALAEDGRAAQARPHYREALERAEMTSGPWSSLHVLNNWADADLLAGDVESAADRVERLRALATSAGTGLLLAYAGTAAEVLHAQGRSHEGVVLLREHLQAD